MYVILCIDLNISLTRWGFLVVRGILMVRVLSLLLFQIWVPICKCFLWDHRSWFIKFKVQFQNLEVKIRSNLVRYILYIIGYFDFTQCYNYLPLMGVDKSIGVDKESCIPMQIQISNENFLSFHFIYVGNEPSFTKLLRLESINTLIFWW